MSHKSTVMLPEEISVEEAAKILGISSRSVTNYLSSRQLEGVKVGKKWFVKSTSVLAIRPQGMPLHEIKLPALEEPRSKHQVEKQPGKKWEPLKEKTSQRGLQKLSAFIRLHNAYLFFLQIAQEIENPAICTFIKTELESVTGDVGAGYYSFGPMKLKLYTRARIKMGRLVSIVLLNNESMGPQFSTLCMDSANAIAALCKRIEKPRLIPVKKKETLTNDPASPIQPTAN